MGAGHPAALPEHVEKQMAKDLKPREDGYSVSCNFKENKPGEVLHKWYINVMK